MKKKNGKVSRLFSLVLVAAMLMSAVVALGVTASADEYVPGTATALPGGATVWDGTVSETLEGDGAEATPYLIQTPGDFVYFRNNATAETTAGKYYKITADLYFNDVNYVGEDGSTMNALSALSGGQVFSGYLDGGEYTLYNLVISSSSSSSATNALFNTINGTVENMNLRGLNLTTQGTAATFAVSLTDGAVIRNCHVYDSTLSGTTVGGLVTYASVASATTGATIDKSSFGGAITATSTCGGILGCSNSSLGIFTITDCVNTANITSTAARLGGIVGDISNGDSAFINKVTVQGCRNTGALTTTTTAADGQVGGIIGYTNRIKTFTISECENTGTIDAGAAATVGGILAYAGNGGGTDTTIVMTDCVNRANVTAGSNVGGLIGRATGIKPAIKITNCANFGHISGADYVGGFCGYLSGQAWAAIDPVVNNCANYGNVTASGSYAGLFAGYLESAYGSAALTFNNGILMGTVTATDYAAAVIGCAKLSQGNKSSYNIAFKNSYMKADLSVSKAGGRVAIFSPSSLVSSKTVVYNLNTTDSSFLVTATVKGTAQESVYSAYDTTGTGYTTVLTTGNASDLTDGTVLGKLNTYAKANGYAPWVQGTTAPEQMTFALALSGATLSLGGEMTLNMKLAAAKMPSVDGATVALKDNLGNTFAGVLNETEGYYTFVVGGISAADMAELRDYHLAVTVNEITYESLVIKAYSPMAYAQRMYNGGTAALQKLLIGMVGYVDAAQINRYGSSTAIADFIAATGYEGTIDVSGYNASKMTLSGVSAADLNTYVTVAANLDSSVNMVLKLKEGQSAAKLRVTVDDQNYDYEFVDGEATVTDLHAGMLLNELTLALLDSDGNSLATGTYSVGNFLALYLNDEYTVEVQNLAKAAAIYMYAVRAYAMQ